MSAEGPSETEELRERIAATPFFTALRDSTLPRASFGGLLRALATVYETIEGELGRVSEPPVQAVVAALEPRLPALERDLASLRIDGRPEATLAQLEAVLIVQQLRVRALTNPVSLLAAVGLIERALALPTLERQLARCFDLKCEGLAYVTACARDAAALEPERLQALAAELTREESGPWAHELLRGLAAVLAALHPLESAPLGTLVRRLNPEAGAHPIADDLREVDAALRAGEASWLAFPYYEARYGARGRRFTRSDSAWLVTLCRLNAVSAHKHVTWLARVLAARGMPRLMLEQHLDRLHDVVCSMLPGRADEYAPLRSMASALREARFAWVPQGDFERITHAFERRVDHTVRTPLAGVGGLIVSAVADERDGVHGAVPSLADWLTDGNRFEPAWVSAVQATLREARAL